MTSLGENKKEKLKNLNYLPEAVCLVLFFILCVRIWIPSGNHGLLGEYYFGTDFDQVDNVQINETIDFNWRILGPLRNFRRETFSIRWTGFIEIEEDNQYQIFTKNDDGVRLWIDETLVINDWRRHWQRVNKRQLDLKAGIYPIRIEYFQHIRGAQMALYWKKKGEKKFKIVPARVLYPDRASLSRAKKSF